MRKSRKRDKAVGDNGFIPFCFACRIYIFHLQLTISFECDILYSLHKLHIFSQQWENTFGKKCFLSFLVPLLRVCVAAFEGSIFSVHSFGGALFYFWSGFMVVTCCGHSQYTETVEDEEKIISILMEIVGDCSADLFLGGYGSFDEFALKCGKKYQKTHPNTRLVFVTPYITLDYQKNHLRYQKDLYDDIVYPELENVPLKFAISLRNRWMIERSDYVIAYITHDWGGAYQSYKYAKKREKNIFNIIDFHT